MGSRMVRAFFPAILFGFLIAPRIVSCGEGSAPKAPSQPSPQRAHYFSQVSISPDGQFVAWSQVQQGDDSRNSEPELWLADLLSANPPRRITVRDGKTRKAGHDAVWSPDGKQLAFLCGTGKNNQRQIYVVPRSSGQPKQLTHLTGAISDLHWSPDGKSISYLFIENP